MGMTTTTTPRHPATYFHVGKYTLYSAPYDQHPPSLDICTVPILYVWTCWKLLSLKLLSFLSSEPNCDWLQSCKLCEYVTKYLCQLYNISHKHTQRVHTFLKSHLVLPSSPCLPRVQQGISVFSFVPGTFPGTWLRRFESARFKRTWSEQCLGCWLLSRPSIVPGATAIGSTIPNFAIFMAGIKQQNMEDYGRVWKIWLVCYCFTDITHPFN